MDASLKLPDGTAHPPVLGWFVFYAMWVAALFALVALVACHAQWSWPGWPGGSWVQIKTWAATQFRAMDWDLKLAIYLLYVSVACTFVPLNVNIIASLLAMQQAGLAPAVLGPQHDAYALPLVVTVLLVSVLGAVGSTVANLTDYHIYMLIFRSRRVARIRSTRLYEKASRWFAKSPFGLLVLFNIAPIPIDVARILAVADAYPRVPFAVSNFVGRFIRYAVIAAVTFVLGKELGWIAPVSLLAAAVVMVLLKLMKSLLWRPARRITRETL
ncbi:MAG: hypothetical protein ABFD92_14135 [Planctomycetaceae bacterium]|nr:VTT domain-containing protein [Planctomycetaceae bacterium]